MPRTETRHRADRRRGEKWERYVGEWLERKGCAVEYTEPWRDKLGIDIDANLPDGTPFTVQVKGDEAGARPWFGRRSKKRLGKAIAIEVRDRGAQGWLYKDAADLHISVIPPGTEAMYLLNLPLLRRLRPDPDWPRFQRATRNDNGARTKTDGYRVPCFFALEHGLAALLAEPLVLGHAVREGRSFWAVPKCDNGEHVWHREMLALYTSAQPFPCGVCVFCETRKAKPIPRRLLRP